MSITYVGGQTAGFAGKTTETTVTFALTGGLAATPAAGDLVVVAYTVGSLADRTLYIRNASAVDYTLMGAELYQDDTYDANLRVAYRVMPGTPETTCVLSGTGDIQSAGAYAIHVFRGVDPTTPMDVTVVTTGGVSTRLPNPDAVTPVTAGAWVYAAGGGACGTGAAFTHATLTAFQSTRQNDTQDAVVGAGYYDGWTSGAYDPAAFADGGTDTADDSWCAVTAALRPAALSVPIARRRYHYHTLTAA